MFLKPYTAKKRIMMKRRIDYASMNWFEKRRVLRLERKVQNRKLKKDLGSASPGSKIAWGRILIFIVLIVAAYYYREQVIGFIKGLF